MKRKIGVAAVLLGLVAFNSRNAAQQTPDWGNGVAPFALALIGDMPYGAAREAPFARLVAEINRDNDVDFVMHAGDIKAGSERCDDTLIEHRFGLYQTFQRAFVTCPGGFEAFLTRLEMRAQQYGRPVMLAQGDDHVFILDQPLPNVLFSRLQTFGEGLVHWVKVRVDPKSTGVFSVEQKIVKSNL